mmetsp:Transcript_16608/g.23578  ORF Transcript_16608/g.23578 Transcript_16608/m.23578 type:complete len:97 (-) Transcript_16608:4940-5230(-)
MTTNAPTIVSADNAATVTSDLTSNTTNRHALTPVPRGGNITMTSSTWNPQGNSVRMYKNNGGNRRQTSTSSRVQESDIIVLRSIKERPRREQFLVF